MHIYFLGLRHTSFCCGRVVGTNAFEAVHRARYSAPLVRGAQKIHRIFCSPTEAEVLVGLHERMNAFEVIYFFRVMMDDVELAPHVGSSEKS